jgi:predicted DNA-binding transcriptional regulator AlpA
LPKLFNSPYAPSGSIFDDPKRDDITTRLISLKEVERRTNRSRWWVNSETKAGRFPRPVVLHGRRISFVEAEIENWVRIQIARRDHPSEQAKTDIGNNGLEAPKCETV